MTVGSTDWFRDLTLDNTPAGWFDPEGEVVRGVANAIAEPASFNFGQLVYIQRQARLATATDGFLDLIAEDYFGRGRFKRRNNEIDADYRSRLQAEILRPLGTRAAIIDVITDLTGHAPDVFEPANSADSGWIAGADTKPSKPFAFGRGRLGSRGLPFQFFITITRPASSGFPGRSGLSSAPSGFGSGRFALGNKADREGIVTDEEIYATVARTIPAGVTAWVRIKSGV